MISDLDIALMEAKLLEYYQKHPELVVEGVNL